jgi:hypothetical protein
MSASLRFDGVHLRTGMVFSFPPEWRSAWPESPPDGDYMKSSVVWTFPSTSITLLRVHSLRYGFGYVTINYEAIDKKALDVL